jgi:microcystin-dependent protein
MTGSPNVTIATNQLPLHNHLVQAAESLPLQAATPGPSTWLGYSSAARTYVNTATPNTTLSPSMIGSNSGGSIPHDNMQPFLTVNFCIAFTGAFPPRG